MKRDDLRPQIERVVHQIDTLPRLEMRGANLFDVMRFEDVKADLSVERIDVEAKAEEAVAAIHERALKPRLIVGRPICPVITLGSLEAGGESLLLVGHISRSANKLNTGGTVKERGPVIVEFGLAYTDADGGNKGGCMFGFGLDGAIRMGEELRRRQTNWIDSDAKGLPHHGWDASGVGDRWDLAVSITESIEWIVEAAHDESLNPRIPTPV